MKKVMSRSTTLKFCFWNINILRVLGLISLETHLSMFVPCIHDSAVLLDLPLTYLSFFSSSFFLLGASLLLQLEVIDSLLDSWLPCFFIVWVRHSQNYFHRPYCWEWVIQAWLLCFWRLAVWFDYWSSIINDPLCSALVCTLFELCSAVIFANIWYGLMWFFDPTLHGTFYQ